MSEYKAEEIFNKTEKEMSEMERMMADIMAKNTASPEKAEEIPPVVPVPKPPEKKKRVIHPVPERPVTPGPAVKTDAESETAGGASTARQTISKNNESAKKALKSKKLPVAAVFVAFIVIAGLLFGAMLKTIRGGDNDIDNPEGYTNAKTESGVDFIIPTPEPSSVIEAIENGIEPGTPGNIVIMSGTNNEIDYSQGEHYQIYTDDVSWSEAKSNCEHFNGHMVTISDDEELEEIKELANLAGVSYVWVGCHRNALGELEWENGEIIDIPAEWWAKGEPSKFDFGDNVPEDYLLLWKHNGIWELNDSRNNPVLDYPEMYRGNIAYICEFEEK